MDRSQAVARRVETATTTAEASNDGPAAHQLGSTMILLIAVGR
jgi:hypothetical protein